jgi:hypothetical protein
MINPDDLEELQKIQRYQAGAWQQVVDCARQYAMMEAFGSYIENGNKINVSFSDKKRYAEMFIDNLKFAAQHAFAEDAMLGSAMHTARSE